MTTGSDEMAEERPTEIARLGSVLVPTDLSSLGNAIIPFAYALVAPGGRVHLLHVLEEHSIPNPLYAHYQPGRFLEPEERAAFEAALVQRLHALVPPEAARRSIETRFELAHEGPPAAAIQATAQRLDVDAVCIATHGRSGLSKLVAGSVASEVAAACTKPLLMLRPRLEE